jgi:hypothetical protein
VFSVPGGPDGGGARLMGIKASCVVSVIVMLNVLG